MLNMGAFLSYVFVTTFTPGPNNILSMSNATRYGFKKSIFFNIGIFFGFSIVMGLCSLFSATLLNLLPAIKPYMTYVGAAYILWLAWKTFKSEYREKGEDTKPTNTFQYGFLLQFVNPKVILYGITTVSTFILPYFDGVMILAGFAMLLAFVAFVSTCCWALFGSAFHTLLMKHNKIVNIVMSLLLVYCAISLFI